MMKVLSFDCTFVYWTTLLLLSLLPNLSLACSCEEPPSLNGTLYDNPNSIVIGGKINDEIKLTTTDEFSNRYFAFKVKKVHKAPCYIQDGDVIVVSTAPNSALCGVDLKPYTRYTFAAFAVQDDNPLIPTLAQVRVASCDYRVEGALSLEDKQTVRTYNKEQSHSKKCNTASPCETGADCDQENEYCNVATNQCVAINAKCPTRPVDCYAAPCTVTLPCDEAAGAAGPLTCLDNYCGGCNAIFLDANRSLVCSNSLSSEPTTR